MLPDRHQQEGGHLHFDLFCGPGGFATGFEWAGFTTKVGVDINGPALSTFARMHPSASTLEADIRDVGADDLRALSGGVQPAAMTAGIPCEGFSRSNRNRNQFVDLRNFLFLEFLRLAEAFRPPVVVIENVSALKTHSDGFFRKEICCGLDDLGYHTFWEVLNAEDYGVPQRRKRLIFVGVADGLKFAWPLPSHGTGRVAPRTVREALSDLPAVGPGEATTTYTEPPENDYQRLLRGDQELLLNHRAPNHPKETIDRIASTRPGEPLYPRFKQRIRLHPDRSAPTIVAGGVRPQFSHGHPWSPRGLTIRERARLQSFPDSYDFGDNLVNGRAQTGDAVPPLLAWRLGLALRAALQGTTDEDEAAISANRGALFSVDAA